MTATPAQSFDRARRRTAAAVAAIAALLVAIALVPSAAEAKTKWLCKPGEKPNPCKGSLETTRYASDGGSTVETPKNARKPKFDCFYVYPTVSEQQTDNANKDIDPQQTAIAEYQAARYSQTCRVYAPVYRQATLKGIGGPELDPSVFDLAFDDVLEAWRTYMRKYNDGRGVVLIGHSQGTGMLSTLLRKEIEKHRAQHRKLISAVLLGGNVVVPKGKDVGGTFRSTPLCHTGAQTGCVIAFSTFNQTPPEDALFGRTTGALVSVPKGADPADYRVACTNPADLDRRPRSHLETIARSEPFPGTLGVGIGLMYGFDLPTADTPWLVPQDHYTGACVRHRGSNVLMISPIAGARELTPSPNPGWGLHLLDGNVALGNMVDIVQRQAKLYLHRN
ncbi:MAG: alpha/beta fold hydrolase [Solirubrobacterales bacterium]